MQIDFIRAGIADLYVVDNGGVNGVTALQFDAGERRTVNDQVADCDAVDRSLVGP